MLFVCHTTQNKVYLILSYLNALMRGQAHNVVNLDFKLNLTLKVKFNYPAKIGILTNVFYTSDPNLVILAFKNEWWVIAQTKLLTSGRTSQHLERRRQLQYPEELALGKISQWACYNRISLWSPMPCTCGIFHQDEWGNIFRASCLLRTWRINTELLWFFNISLRAQNMRLKLCVVLILHHTEAEVYCIHWICIIEYVPGKMKLFIKRLN